MELAGSVAVPMDAVVVVPVPPEVDVALVVVVALELVAAVSCVLLIVKQLLTSLGPGLAASPMAAAVAVVVELEVADWVCERRWWCITLWELLR